MAAIDPQPYINAATCDFCKIPPGMIWYAVLAGLIDVGNGDPVPTDTNALMEEATCLFQCIPAGYLPYAILAAVSNISGGGGGGTQQVYRNEPIPDDPTLPALSFPSGGGTLTQWDPDLAAWV